MIRLVACDLDGTLLRSDQTISAATIAQVRRLVAAGVVFLPVTGRPIRTLHQLISRYGLDMPMICVNGAAIYDARRQALIDHRPIRTDVLNAVTTRIRAQIRPATFAAEVSGGQRLAYEPEFWVDQATPASSPVTLGELVRLPVAKLIVRAPGVPHDEVFECVRQNARGLAEVTQGAAIDMAEVSALGVTKGAALSRFAGALNISSRDVVVFGDMPNDITMMAWARLSVAVANAHPSVLAIASHMTESNDQDGVASYLRRTSPLLLPQVADRHIRGGRSPDQDLAEALEQMRDDGVLE